MNRWLTWTVRLYPPRWRARYSEEFHALLEDVRPGPRAFADIVRGALLMRISDGTTFLKLAAVLCAAGAVVAIVAAYAAPRPYISSAVIQVTRPPDADDFGRQQFTELQEEVLSRSQLTAMIQQPTLDLYKKERYQMPISDVADQMRRNIQIRQISPDSYRISFGYPSRVKAQEVTRLLTTKILEGNRVLSLHRARIWHGIRADLNKMNADRMAAHKAVQKLPPNDPPTSPDVSVVEVATLPDHPVAPDFLPFLSWGMLLGIGAALAIWRPKGISRIAACGIAGCFLAIVVSFLLPMQYTSRSVMRFIAAKVPETLSGVTPTTTAETFAALERQVMSDENLARLITSPALQLYPQERARAPMA